MNKIITAAVVLLILLSNQAYATSVQENTDNFGPFGKLQIYQTSAHPKQVTLLVSGDDGWDSGMIALARSLAEMDSLVVGIDFTHYVRQLDESKSKCSYPAAHFEELSQYIQKKFNFPYYILPVLTGYSSGATLVYTTLAQSPPNTFSGGIGIRFSPELKSIHPMCKGSGVITSTANRRHGFDYSSVPTLAASLLVLQGDADRVYNTADIKNFLSKIKNAELIELPGVGHDFSAQEKWLPQFRDAFRKTVAARHPQTAVLTTPDELNDLPLVLLPAAQKSDTLAVMVSGDGGWAGIDKQVSEALNKDGINVVGLNSLQYFWEKKDPDIAGKDLARILTHFTSKWGTDKLILIGYSSGADTLPFMINRLPESLRSAVQTVALLGVASQANFEFHVSDWLVNSDGMYLVIPELQKLKGMNVLCISGEEESDSACRSLDKAAFHVIEMKGGHHFSGDYEGLARIILGKGR